MGPTTERVAMTAFFDWCIEAHMLSSPLVIALNTGLRRRLASSGALGGLRGRAPRQCVLRRTVRPATLNTDFATVEYGGDSGYDKRLRERSLMATSV